MTTPAAPGPSLLRLCALMVRFRTRHLWNGVFRAGPGRGLRLFALVGLIVPVAYLGLFMGAFASIARTAGRDVQAAALALVVGGLLLGSLLAKVVSAEAVLAGTAENEFYMARPISLSRLMAARSLAAAALDFWGALFLLPVLAGVALIWRLGAAGVTVAFVTSVITQVGVVALAQAVQVLLVRIVGPGRRPALWTALALASAFSVAALWLLATFVLRAPERFAGLLSPWAEPLLRSPLVLWIRPLRALAEGRPFALASALSALAATSAALVVVGALVARWSSRHGWENAGEPWAERPVRPRPRAGRGAPLSVAGKDLRLLLRDRARLLTLLAMPIIFVGIQIFGAAGVSFSPAHPERLAVLAYSMCAYLAIIGPLPHMQAERRAFWILRSVPVSLSRLMLQKALAWTVLMLAVVLMAYLGLGSVFFGGALLSPASLRALALVIFGVVVVTALAIAMGCDAADLSRTGKAAVGPGTVYLFLVVAGLYNVVLLEGGALVVRGSILFVAAALAYWATGMRRAADAADPEVVAVRRATPGDGLAVAILLFLGTRATAVGAAAGGLPPQAGAAAATFWAASLAMVVGGQLLWRGYKARAFTGGRLWRAIAVGGVGAGAFHLLAELSPTRASPTGALVLVLAHELLFRGLLQGTVEQALRPRPGAAAAAWLATLVVALAASPGPLSWPVLVPHALAGLARAAGGGVAAALLARVLPLALG